MPTRKTWRDSMSARKTAGTTNAVGLNDVVSRVASQAVHRAKRQAIADAERAADRPLYDEMRQARRSGRDGVFGRERTLERAEDADQEEVQKEQEQDPDAPEKDRERDLHLVGRAELKLDTADRKAISVGQHDLGDTPAVHIRAVRALKVVQRVSAQAETDLGVLPRDPAVVERDVVLRVAADRERLGPKDDVATVIPFAHRDRGLGRSRLLA